ncbi:MAG: DNA-3-methyladenine glycosylase [Patescibacteria group bacterium]
MWEEAEKNLSKNKIIAPLIKKYGPCKIKARPKKNYFVDLVDAITGQQLSGKAAATIFGRVKKEVGSLTPENILETKDERLRACGLSWAKVKYVKDLSARIMNNELRIKYLKKLSDEEVIKELVAVKGIGPWTADMFLMFTLGRPDIFPVLDLGIKNGVKKLTKKALKPKEIAEFGKQFAPYRTVASWYIWAALDN